MIKVLVNVATLKKGGGQNVALNFLQQIIKEKPQGFEFVFAVSASSQIKPFLEKNNQEIIVVSDNPIVRMVTEFFRGKSIIKKYKIDIIYTYFGIGLYPKSIKQVSGSADSNLYFPEIDFWKEFKGVNKLKKHLIDRYRIWGLKRAKAIIFENHEMEERGKKLFQLKHTCYIPPSFSQPEESEDFSQLTQNPEEHRGLFLCGWQRNKNFMLIPEIAQKFKEKGVNFKFVISTSTDDSVEYLEFKKLVDQFGVANYIQLVGSVPKSQLPSLFSKIDFVFLLSKLESFSNNIIEAYYYKKPLVISDLDWAKSICGDAAMYVDINNISDISNKVLTLLFDKGKTEDLKQKQSTKLNAFPDIAEKSKMELDYLKKIYESA